MDYSKLCTPALIYFIISFVYLLIYSLSNFSISSIIINTIVIILWSDTRSSLTPVLYNIASHARDGAEI